MTVGQNTSVKEDSINIVKLLNEVSKDSDSIIQLEKLKKALYLSKELKFYYGIFESYKKIAVLKKTKNNSAFVVEQYKKGIHDLPNSNKYIYNLYELIGNEFKTNSKYDSALYYYNKSIKFGNKSKNNELIAIGYLNIGSMWLQNYQYSDAFKNYAKADSICENDDKLKISVLRAQINNYLGYSVRITHGYEKAIKYYKISKKLHKALNNEFGVQEINIAIAQAEISFGNYEEALKLLNKSIEFHKKYAPEKNSYSYGIIVRGFLLIKMNKFKEAEKDYKLYYNLAVKSKNKTYQRYGLAYLGDFYNDTKHFQTAINYYKKVIDECKKVGDFGRELETYESLTEAYKNNNNLSLALDTYEAYMNLQKKINNKNITEKTVELETKYQTHKKEQQITLLKTENELAKQQKINQRNLFITGIGITSFAGLFFFFLYRNRQKTTRKLQELDQLKSNLFANISHEFRTPLTLISSPIQQQLKKKSISNKDRASFEIIQRNTTRLLDLVNQLLDISKIEAGSIKLKIGNYHLVSFLGKILDGFSFMSHQKDIDFTVNINSIKNQTWFDKDILEKISTNLLLNAIKYTPKKGTIITEVFVKENKLNFMVKNTGEGIASNEILKIFDRFYQLNNHAEGTGIGLALVKELVLLHKGKITVESTPNQWTTFTVLIPIDKKSFKTNEIITEPLINENAEILNFNNNSAIEFQNDTINEETENPIALIVEDNKDVNNYLSTLLEKEYTIIQAVNGKEGISLAFKYIPDIIISDIMMPVKDGVELCNTLKNDERTSHIPIILLTAKAGEENQITGIKAGADAYITKPFNDDLLLIKVAQLIAIRKKLQTRYSQEVILKPADIAVNSFDESFLNQVQIILDTKLIESSFHVDEFCKAIGMSRMQLHRKLKALTGLSTSEFIRSQRLKLAAQLLKTSDINISQVGYSVGFNNHAYFSKCFKEVYKCSPSEYSKR